VAALRRARELDRTYVVFTSDNGYYHGEHRVPREKILPYEPGIRVPLVIRGPGSSRTACRCSSSPVIATSSRGATS
jgi:arylsulfatase A-like enzyme